MVNCCTRLPTTCEVLNIPVKTCKGQLSSSYIISIISTPTLTNKYDFDHFHFLSDKSLETKLEVPSSAERSAPSPSHPDINQTYSLFNITFPNTVESLSNVLQFHLLFWNWYWHSFTPILTPRPMLTMTSGYVRHNCLCLPTRPGILSQSIRVPTALSWLINLWIIHEMTKIVKRR